MRSVVCFLVGFFQFVLASATNDSLILVRFGQSVPLTGSDALDGILYRDGILAAFQEFNDDPRPDKTFQLELQVKDDVGDPPTAKANVQKFVSDASILGIIGLLGTTSTELASPVAFAAGVPVIAPYGGVTLRQPFQKYMMNLRASYYDEAASLVEFLHHGLERIHIALFVQNGPLGFVTRDGVLAALDSNNIYLHSYTLYSKKGNDSLWLTESIAALNQMQKSSSSNTSGVGPDSIIIAADYQPASIFIPLARQRFPEAILVCLSRVSVMVLIDVVASKLGSASVLNGLFVSQVVPLPTDPVMRVVRQYQAALTKIGKTQWTFSGLEGYLMGQLAIEALERIRGLNYTSALFTSALYETGYFNLQGLRVGPFLDNITEMLDGYDGLESCNQGMRQVIMTVVQQNNTLVKADTLAFDTCGYKIKQWNSMTFGQSCTYNGSRAALCVGFRDGLLAMFKQVNDAGGIRGTTRLKLLTKEDRGNKAIGLANNLALMDDPNIFGLVGTSVDGIKELLEARPQDFVLGTFDGDVELRDPFRRNVVNVRASVADECYAIVHHCYYVLHVTKIAVLYEATAVGEVNMNHFVDALSEKRLELLSQDAYTANNLTKAVATLLANPQAGKMEAVLFIGSDDVFGDVVVGIHSRKPNVWIFGLSKTITTRLMLTENRAKVNWDKLLLSSCVPDVTNQSIQIVEQYTAALKSLDNSLTPSPAGLEGYVVGQLLATSLNSIIADSLTVDNVLDAIYDHGIFKMSDFRCGPLVDSGEESSYCNQCMKHVYLVHFNTTSNTTLPTFAFDTCMYNPAGNYDYGLGGTRMVVIVGAALGSVYTVGIMGLLIHYRHSPHVAPISVRFALVSCGGGLLCYGGVFLGYPIPTNFTCAFIPWLVDLAFVTLFGPIFAKAYRIDRIFNGKKLRRQVISDLHVFEIFMAILLCFMVFLIVYTVVDVPRVVERFTYTGVRFEKCSTRHAVFEQIDYVMKALLLIWGCFLCQRVSKVTGRFARFNESKEMVLCIYHTTFLAVCMLLIGMTTTEKPNVQYACESVLVMENTLVVVTVLYARPVTRALQHRELTDNSDASTGSSTSQYPSRNKGSNNRTSMKKPAGKVAIDSGKSGANDISEHNGNHYMPAGGQSEANDNDTMDGGAGTES